MKKNFLVDFYFFLSELLKKMGYFFGSGLITSNMSCSIFIHKVHLIIRLIK